MHTTPSNKRYIGITCQSINQRWRNGEGYQRCTGFYRAIQKYGWINIKHEILLENLTFEEATDAEKHLIKKYKTHDKRFGYNCTDGGEGVLGWTANEEQREKNSKAKIEQWKNPEMRQKLVKERQERGATQKEQERLRKMVNENWNNPEMREKFIKHLREIANDEERKTNHSKELKRQWAENPEKFMMNRNYKKGAENKRSKPVRCINTGKVYVNARAANNATGISYKEISACCNGKRKSVKGTQWEFISK
jgi:hypothetical protein